MHAEWMFSAVFLKQVLPFFLEKIKQCISLLETAYTEQQMNITAFNAVNMTVSRADFHCFITNHTELEMHGRA